MYEVKSKVHMINRWLSESQLCISSNVGLLSQLWYYRKSYDACYIHTCYMWWHDELYEFERLTCGNMPYAC